MTITSNLPEVSKRIQSRLQATQPGDTRLLKLMFSIGSLLELEANKSYKASGLKVRTGFLINSMRARYARTSTGARLEFAPWGVKYAAIHEYGGVIRPKQSDYLKFKIGNRWVQTKRVKIPARPYLQPTLMRARLRVRELVQEYARGN